jgi:hypothetical protein
MKAANEESRSREEGRMSVEGIGGRKERREGGRRDAPTRAFNSISSPPPAVGSTGVQSSADVRFAVVVVVPGSQGVHADDAFSDAKKPTSHFRHMLCPTSGWNFPDSQGRFSRSPSQ